MSLNVMVLESDRGAADETIRALEDAGHVVLRCHEPGRPSFPCKGVVDQSQCPMHSHSVDVALTVRSRPRSQPAPGEDGVRCAIMSRVPLVVAGPSLFDPFDGWEMRVVDRDSDVVGAVEDVAQSELPRHTLIATEALRATPNSPELLAEAHASVTRDRGYLRAVVAGLDSLAPRQRDAAIVRMVAKVREFDASARGIDVVMSRA